MRSHPSDGKISTGVPGLDDILQGGFVRGGFYLLQGDPGSGKTTIALQYLLSCSRIGEPGLYITLTESAWEIASISQGHGWQADVIPVFDLTQSRANLSPTSDDTIFYPSEVALVETTQQIIAEVERRRPSHVVFDGLSEMRLLSADPLRYRHQMLALKHFFAQNGTTVLLLDDRSAPSGVITAESLVSGNIVLERHVPAYGGMRRRLQVTKIRGAAFRDGFHDYDIARGGVIVYPRHATPEQSSAPSDGPYSPISYTSDIPNLDSMLGGGLDSGTTTLLMGPSGVGKSTVAMNYVAAALDRGEKAAVFLFDEGLPIFYERVEKLGARGVRQYAANGQLLTRPVNPAELSPGSFASEVRKAVATGARIIVIDSLNGYMNAMTEERFLAVHLHELFTYLNQEGILTLAIVAQHGLVGLDPNQIDVSYLADTVLLFRNFEAQGRILKAVGVFKKRTGAHEQTLRQLSITSEGITVGEPLESFRGIMTGVPEYEGHTTLTLNGEAERS